MATLRKRGSRWHVQVRRKGFTPLTRSFAVRAEGEAWARQIEAGIDRGEPTAAPGNSIVTVGELLLRYVSSVTPKKKSHVSESCRIQAMRKHPIAELTVGRLTVTHVASYRDERLRTVSAPTVRRELVILRHCLVLAKREWSMGVMFDPIRALTSPPSAPHRERRVTSEELQRLAEALKTGRNAIMVSVLRLAIVTGMRRSELLSLTWRHVDIKRSLAFLPDSKNGHARHVPLSPMACQILNMLPGGAADKAVLPISANALRLSWERLKRRACIDNLRFHDLRHEAISRFFEAGLSVPEVSLISGHRDPRMLLRYTHLRPEAVAERLKHCSHDRETEFP